MFLLHLIKCLIKWNILFRVFLGQSEPNFSPCFALSIQTPAHCSEVLCQEWFERRRCRDPHLRLAERRSGSLHLGRRFSNLISGRRAKGWRPRPDPPQNGVCVKRFYSDSGKKGATPGSPAPLPWPPCRPSAVTILCVCVEKCFKLSAGEQRLKWCWSSSLSRPRHLCFLLSGWWVLEENTGKSNIGFSLNCREEEYFLKIFLLFSKSRLQYYIWNIWIGSTATPGRMVSCKIESKRKLQVCRYSDQIFEEVAVNNDELGSGRVHRLMLCEEISKWVRTVTDHLHHILLLQNITMERKFPVK